LFSCGLTSAISKYGILGVETDKTSFQLHSLLEFVKWFGEPFSRLNILSVGH
jgi:hypothetical protein